MLVAFFANNIALAAEGDVSLTPASKNIGASTEFDIEVHLDTNSKKIGAFNMFLDFDPAKVTVNTAIGTADNGLDAGADTTHYNCMVNDTDIANGHYRFACIGAFSSSHDSWYANGGNVHIATIHVKTTAGFTSGTASLTIRGDDGDSNNGLELELSDDTGHALALGTITGETLTYSNSMPGISTATSITTPNNDNTPVYTFTAVDLAGNTGTATWGGSCNTHFPTTTDAIVNGDNPITATTAFSEGTYSDCTLQVNDGTNDSNLLHIPEFVIDTTAPVLTEQTAVTTPTSDTTPDYTFTSDEAGTITYGGDCSSSDTSAVNGSNTITFNTLANGTHSNCTITVTDAAGNISSVLNVASFEVNAPTCTSYTYSSWGSCQPSNTRTRTVLTSIPSGCVGGVSPVLSESCTYTAPAAGGVDVNNFTPKVKLKGVSKKIKLKKHKKVYIRKKKLSFKGDIDDLAGGRVEIYVDGDLKETATIGSNGKWKMKVKIKKSGKHKLRFKYFNATGDYIGESSRYYIKIDTRKPRFIHLPSFLTKYRGNVVHFEATDSKSKKVKTKKKNKIKYYKYYFLGKKVKTKKSSFVIPKNTLRGLHTLKVRAYDKAGNKTTKYVVIRVR